VSAHATPKQGPALGGLDGMGYLVVRTVPTSQGYLFLAHPHPLQVHSPCKQLRGKWMVSLINSNANATSKKWHVWEIDLRFALNSTAGWT